MFVSANFLAIQYGVDDAIAQFFVDREPPVNNLYWHKKLMYLRPEPGFLFIPLIVDLLYKSRLEKPALLSEDFVGLMEAVGHISALEETKQIDKGTALAQCFALANYQCKTAFYKQALEQYFSANPVNPIGLYRTPYNALHRGDAFLFALCALAFEQDKLPLLVQHWFALISSLLLLDDAEDIEIDQSAGDENAFLESGLSAAGLAGIKALVTKNLQHIDRINKPMAITLDKKFKTLASKPLLASLINF